MATFGYYNGGTPGASTDITAQGGAVIGSIWTVPADCSAITKLTAYLSQDSEQVKGAIFSMSNGNADGTLIDLAPDTYLSLSGSPNWFDLTFSSPPAVTPSSTILLAVIVNYGGTTFNYDGSGTSIQNSPNSFASPASFSNQGAYLNTQKYSIYATYTPSGGGAKAKWYYDLLRRS